MMENPDNHLTWMERVRTMFRQDGTELLYRKGRNVMRISVDRFFEITDDEFLTDFAYFSELVYGEPDEESRHLSTGWEFCREYFEKDEPIEGMIASSLKYHLWYHKYANVAVIAFRGTQGKADWFANARWLTRYIPGVRDHYDVVKERIAGMVGYLQDHYGEDVDIVTTGHSLGGGLAQQAAYSSLHVRSVFAFDPSPVTGYRGLKKVVRETNSKGLRIVRVFEHGEVLAYLRFFMRKLYRLSTKDPEIIELRFNFSKSNVVAEHSMGMLATNLLDNWAPREDESESEFGLLEAV